MGGLNLFLTLVRGGLVIFFCISHGLVSPKMLPNASLYINRGFKTNIIEGARYFFTAGQGGLGFFSTVGGGGLNFFDPVFQGGGLGFYFTPLIRGDLNFRSSLPNPSGRKFLDFQYRC